MAIVLSAALAPVLILSAIQSDLIFQREVLDQRAEMTAAAERSAAAVGARIDSAEVLLRTLVPAASGAECQARLADIGNRIPGYVNFIRFDPAGEVVCGAAVSPSDPRRVSRPWFRALLDGAADSVTSEPGADYAREPAILTSIRIDGDDRRMVGVLSGVITLASLRPEKDGRTVPVGSEVALVDGRGRFLTSSRLAAFPAALRPDLTGRGWGEAVVWSGKDRQGEDRVFTAAPLPDQDIHVLLSAPKRDVVSWAWVNPVSAIGLPVLAFVLALVGVWIVADRGVVQWIGYLQRIAVIYARGRYGVHPVGAVLAPPEIRHLAESLDAMAATIAARDKALRENLVQKDALLREIHHRVKNNLQVISSLLNMQQRALTDPAARAAISDTRQRISALALIYRALYEGPDLMKVDLGDFLEDLIGQLMIGDMGRRATIRTRLSIDTLAIDPDQLAPVALFAVEAITNARNHGLGDASGVLDVTFRVLGAQAELTIADSGRPAPDAVAGEEGVGRTLMTAFARQLKGEVTFGAASDTGMTVQLRFPIPAAKPGG